MQTPVYSEFLNNLLQFITGNLSLLFIVPVVFGSGLWLFGHLVEAVKRDITYEVPSGEEKSIYYPDTRPVAYHQPTRYCPWCGTQRTHYDRSDCPKCGGPYEEE